MPTIPLVLLVAYRSARVADGPSSADELDRRSACDLARPRFKVFGSVIHQVIDAGAEERPYGRGRSLSFSDVPRCIGYPVAEVPGMREDDERRPPVCAGDTTQPRFHSRCPSRCPADDWRHSSRSRRNSSWFTFSSASIPFIANSSASAAARRVNREGCNLCSDFVDQLLKRSERKCDLCPQGRNQPETWRLPQVRLVAPPPAAYLRAKMNAEGSPW